jgi:hypothetical protein
MFWSGEKRERYIAAVRVGWGWGLGGPYERLWSFFASYIAVLSGSSQLSLMADQYALWRTARAIATAILILSMQVMLIAPFRSIYLYDFVLSFVLPVMALAITYLFTLGTYSRLCFTMFSLLYVTHCRAIEASGDAARPKKTSI